VSDEVVVDRLGKEEGLRCVCHTGEATRARPFLVPPVMSESEAESDPDGARRRRERR
jgi:hypothetical protein